MHSSNLYEGPPTDGTPVWFCEATLVPSDAGWQWRPDASSHWEMTIPRTPAFDRIPGARWVQVRKRPPERDDELSIHTPGDTPDLDHLVALRFGDLVDVVEDALRVRGGSERTVAGAVWHWLLTELDR